MMGKISLAVIISVLVFVSCQDDQQITSPVNSNDIITEYVSGNDSLMQEQQDAIDLPEPNWISLPLPEQGSAASFYSTSKWIYKNHFGLIILEHGYFSSTEDSVKLYASLWFNPNTIQEDSLFITLKIDAKNGTIIFEPHAQFNIPARLTYSISGLNLEGINSNEIDFIYASDLGDIENIEYDYISVNQEKGSIYLSGGNIYHFSRYGFVK